MVLNFNGLKYLKKTIPSLLSINYPNYEIIFVDNSSSDKSVNFLKKKEKIRVIENKQNWGYSKGKNIGVKQAKGKYILLLDEDILVNNKSILKELIKFFPERKTIFTISLALVDEGKKKTEYCGGYYSLTAFRRPRVKIDKIINHSSDLIKIGAPDGGALFFEKSLFEKVGGYDTSQPYFLDVGDLGARGTILTGKYNYLYTKLILTHLGKERLTDNKRYCWKKKYVFSGISKIIFKNFRVKNIVLIYPLCFLATFSAIIKQAILRKNLCVVKAFFISCYIFIKSLPETLKKRKDIQSKRIIKDDVFLKIKPPKFD